MQASHDHSYDAVIKLRPAGATQHLHNLQIRILLATSSGATLIGDSSLDDYHVTGQIDAYGKGRGTANDANMAFKVSLLDSVSILQAQPSMMECNTGWYRL
jgi:hypothetical protein